MNNLAISLVHIELRCDHDLVSQSRATPSSTSTSFLLNPVELFARLNIEI